MWTADKRLALSSEAIKALREHNEVAIADPEGDSFKVRNLRLILKLR